MAAKKVEKLKESKLIWMDGNLVPWADAKVHVLTHSLHYGVAVFEGIRCYPQPDGRGAIVVDAGEAGWGSRPDVKLPLGEGKSLTITLAGFAGGLILSAIKRDLPMPGSPATRATPP